MQFVYEAMTNDGQVVKDTVEAAAQGEAAETLQTKGLVVLRLRESKAGGRVAPRWTARLRRDRPDFHDLILFSRQMKMLLEAGAALVPALQAVEEQATKPSFKKSVSRIREHVERGGNLAEALQRHGTVFNRVYFSMIAAGEATATLPQTFARLSVLVEKQRKTRRTVIGALIYPMLLLVLTAVVAGVLLGFVVPRFGQMFERLNAALPLSTRIMMDVSNFARSAWPFLLAAPLVVAAGLKLLLRMQSVRTLIDKWLIRAPGLGRLASRLLLARILRVWAGLLGSRVGLLDAIEQSRSAVSNRAFRELLDSASESVSSGEGIGPTLSGSKLVDPMIASAIAIGEENGRLSEAVEFVADWMDEENAYAVAAATRIIEPAVLGFMGLIVGAVAMALFVPLFDLAAIAGG